MGESQAQTSPRLQKGRMEKHFFYLGGCRIVNDLHVWHAEMYLRNKITMTVSVVSCSGACGRAFLGSRKENYSDISKVCYPGCIRAMGRPH